jgi:single-stranded DNA-binding protein
MQTRSWDDAATNTKKYRTEVIADRVSFGSTGSGSSSSSSSAQKSSAQPQEDSNDLDTIEYPEEQINAEDIPF